MPKSKLPQREKNALILRLCQALCQIRKEDEAAKFLTDILSKTEAERLALRLKIAELLINNFEYEEIKMKLKVSEGTIARVSEWLKISGEGYRLILERTKSVPEIDIRPKQWSEIKRKFPQYYWPEILLEEIISTAGKRHKRKLEKTIAQLDKKSSLYRRLSSLLSR
ncbi:MAG: YerC/YecD family TrpR-related protein [bacterium]